jgi:hypothetical protein
MTQMSSVIIVTVKPSVEYAKLCMSMRLATPLFSPEIAHHPPPRRLVASSYSRRAFVAEH